VHIYERDVGWDFRDVVVDTTLHDSRNTFMFYKRWELSEGETAIIKNTDTLLDYDVSINVIGRQSFVDTNPWVNHVLALDMSFGDLAKVSFNDTDASKTPHCDVGDWDMRSQFVGPPVSAPICWCGHEY
jgi:hypothetical protein